MFWKQTVLIILFFYFYFLLSIEYYIKFSLVIRKGNQIKQFVKNGEEQAHNSNSIHLNHVVWDWGEGQWKTVLLKLHSHLKQAGQYYYLMGRNKPLEELITDYTRRIGVSLNSLRFLYSFSPINPLFSANRLEMEDGDIIDVIQRDVLASTQTTLFSLPRAKGEMPITLKVGLSGADHHLMYLIGRSTPLEYLFLDYADRMSLLYENTRFR